MNFNTIRNKAFIVTIVLLSGNFNAQSYRKTDSGINVTVKNATVELKWYGENTIRIIKYLSGKTFIKNSLSVIQKEQKTKFSVLFE